MSDLELFLSFVDSFRKKMDQIAFQKEKCRQASYWRELSPYEFEIEVGKWYLMQGYDVKVTQQARDGGVDIVLTKNDAVTYVQCKHYKSKIRAAACRELGGVMLPRKIKKGAIVTLEGATKDAKQYCGDTGIRIVTLRTILNKNRDEYHKFIESMNRHTLPFQSNLPTPYEEREVYGYYIYGNTFHDYENAAEVARNIPIANLTNLCNTKAIVKYGDCYFIIYSSEEKILWLGDYVCSYIDSKSGAVIPPRKLHT